MNSKTEPNIELLPVLKNPKVLIALSGTVFGASIQGRVCNHRVLKIFPHPLGLQTL